MIVDKVSVCQALVIRRDVEIEYYVHIQIDIRVQYSSHFASDSLVDIWYQTVRGLLRPLFPLLTEFLFQHLILFAHPPE